MSAAGGKLKAASVSITVNVVMMAAKTLAAFATGSIALFAEVAHSFFDLMASILAYWGIKKAERPSDETHHFGHYKYENLSSLLQSLLITGTAFVVIYEAVLKLIYPSPVENSEIGISLMLISIPVSYFTSKYLNNAAKHAGGSQALEADSAHFNTDILASVSVLVGLILVKFGIPAGDPISAFIVGMIMLYISYEIGMRAYHVFMDMSPDRETIGKIEEIMKSEKRISRFHKLRARVSGSSIYVDVHIHVRQNMEVRSAHTIAHELKARIMRKVPAVKDVQIHIEPD
ncbi:MAG: cation diffusion facilitator family transporter [Candidatus Micrarchaeota archaeon]|nr:cation diffusion facilitator family transporter [Candidatus Micrarchaeota archaeon]